MLGIALVMVGIILRFLPHIPNVAPVVAIALFSGCYLNKRYSVLVPFILMVISDIFIGMHNVVFFTWGSVLLIAILGVWLKKHKNIFSVPATSVLSSVLFFIITNFGVWLMGWYSHDGNGLVTCYVAALPFLKISMLGDLLYVAAFFGSYELIARKIRSTKLSRVLLTN